MPFRQSVRAISARFSRGFDESISSWIYISFLLIPRRFFGALSVRLRWGVRPSVGRCPSGCAGRFGGRSVGVRPAAPIGSAIGELRSVTRGRQVPPSRSFAASVIVGVFVRLCRSVHRSVAESAAVGIWIFYRDRKLSPTGARFSARFSAIFREISRNRSNGKKTTPQDRRRAAQIKASVDCRRSFRRNPAEKGIAGIRRCPR